MRNVANANYLPPHLRRARQKVATAIKKYRREMKAMVAQSGQRLNPMVLECLNDECREDACQVDRSTYRRFRGHVGYEDILAGRNQAPTHEHPDTRIMLRELESVGVHIAR